MNLRTPDSKGRGNSDYLLCRKCLEDLASFGSLFVTVMRIEGGERRRGVENAASYILAALAKLTNGATFFKGLVEFRRGGKGALDVMREILSEALEGGAEYNRCIVRILRVLGIGEDVTVREIQKEGRWKEILTRMAVEGTGRGENGKEVIMGATSLMNRIAYAQR